MKLSSFILSFLREMGKRLIKEGDELVITPVRGRKRRIRLNRAKYQLILVPEIHEVKIEAQKIYLPSCADEFFEVDLLLFECNGINAYYLKPGEKSAHFILNSSVCDFSFLKNLDVLALGFSSIQFNKRIPSTKGLDFYSPDLRKIIYTDFPILLQGETGVGKTRLASRIHDESKRMGKFIQLNLSAFSKNLIESELFGHERGAFTGAMKESKGVILEADGGTLFLDEIDSVDFSLQTKLLTFLDSGEFRSVGGSIRKSNVRMIYSSGRDLMELVGRGEMRLDFYYRLKDSYHLSIPSLRENREYLENTIDNLLSDMNCSISPLLKEWYMGCPWYGNVRQLRSHLRKKKYLSGVSHFKYDSQDFGLKSNSIALKKVYENSDMSTLAEIKKEFIKESLFFNNGDIKITSKQIGVSENTIRRSVS